MAAVVDTAILYAGGAERRNRLPMPELLPVDRKASGSPSGRQSLALAGAPTAVHLGSLLRRLLSQTLAESSLITGARPGFARQVPSARHPPGGRVQGSLVGLAPGYIVPANAALRGAQNSV